MNNKEVLELKRRMKKDDATFTKLAGCYVDANRNKVVKFNKKFLTLEEDQYYKYLEIAKKTLSGKLGDNLLQLEFPMKEEEIGGRQQSLMAIRDSKLDNEDMLDSFYDLVIDTYDYAGNYLILLYHDAYDVMTRTKDNQKLDESEEVYEYLLCSICPVKLSKPGLGYLTEENTIGPRERDWVVDLPDTGFLFPAFNDRSTDVHATLFYTKNTKEPHAEFMANGLGCDPKRTSTEKKTIFESVVTRVAGVEDDKSQDIYIEVQEKLGEFIDEQEEKSENGEEPAKLTMDTVQTIVKEIGMPEELATKISKGYGEAFEDDSPEAAQLYDEKLLMKNEIRKEKIQLEQQVEELTKQIETMASDDGAAVGCHDIRIMTGKNIAAGVSIVTVDGVKCVAIPVHSEVEAIIVNGEELPVA